MGAWSHRPNLNCPIDRNVALVFLLRCGQLSIRSFDRTFALGLLNGSKLHGENWPGRLLMYEHRTHPLLSRMAFLKRVLMHVSLALVLVCFALGVGVVGYHCFAALPWLDSLLNASMILSGMGEVDPLRTTAAKVFASFYALFSGLAFVAIASTLVAPFAHRILHKLHLGEE